MYQPPQPSARQTRAVGHTPLRGGTLPLPTPPPLTLDSGSPVWDGCGLPAILAQPDLAGHSRGAVVGIGFVSFRWLPIGPL
jgi:hypothetical protein